MYSTLVRSGSALVCACLLSACGTKEPPVAPLSCRASTDRAAPIVPSWVDSNGAIDLARVPDSVRLGPLIWWHLGPEDPEAWFAERNAIVVYRFHYQDWYLVDIRADSLRVMAADSNVIVNLGAYATTGEEKCRMP
jgi:hypothetical protein